MILLKILIKLPFKTSNRVIYILFVTAVRTLPVKEQAEKNTLLALTRLIYSKLQG